MGLDYEKLIEKHPSLKGVISKTSWDYISVSNKGTLNLLRQQWKQNIKQNLKKGLFAKHGGIVKDCVGMGLNKAVIAVGAGPSFNKNKHVLKMIHDLDGRKDFEDRDFIIISSNHQYKPLLGMGIIPDFVIAVDASDVIMKQLCEDIPKIGQHTIFLAGLQMSPRVLGKWDKQGRDIRFYIPATKGLGEKYEQKTGKPATMHKINVGGNVINTAWVIARYYLQSSVFFALGNDLSYPRIDDDAERRKSYYADGDYSTNAKVTGTGRDEARNRKDWMAFTINKSPIIMPWLRIQDKKATYKIDIDPVHTTNNLWVYKTWIEAQVMVHAAMGKKFAYFNCTEGGICGVMCRDDTPEGRMKEENWYLLDEACKRWHTMTLEDAYEYFTECNRRYKCLESDAQNVIVGGLRN
jgi:hypothetical protein